LNKEEIRI